MVESLANTAFINGVNYGNVFIPENFFADQNFYEKNGIPKVAAEYCLCDVTVWNRQQIMTNWLDSMIKESDFSEMKQLGVNFVRLPLGYWNVFDMPYCPNAPTTDSNRMCNLKNIMPSYTYYRPYIDKVMNYAKKYGQKVLLDLHGAPGSQNGASHSGCSVSSVYWDTDWNKQNTLSAVKALAEICNANLASCYGIEVLNEPGWGVDRNHLISYYQDAIKTARQVLPAYVPVVVFEWNPYWYHYEGRWNSLFPYSTYGRVELDTHIYHFENTVW